MFIIIGTFLVVAFVIFPIIRRFFPTWWKLINEP
jgi:hypothetical protein